MDQSQEMFSEKPSEVKENSLNLKKQALTSVGNSNDGSDQPKFKPRSHSSRSINYSVLEGHPHSIDDNPNFNEKNRKLYI